MATKITVTFSGEGENDRNRNENVQPASTKGRAEPVSTPEVPRAELVAQAKEFGVRGYSSMNKGQLQNAINDKKKELAREKKKNAAQAKKEKTKQPKNSFSPSVNKMLDELDEIVNSIGAPPTPPKPLSPKAVLMARAKELGVPRYGKLTKSELEFEIGQKESQLVDSVTETFTEEDLSFDFGANVKPALTEPPVKGLGTSPIQESEMGNALKFLDDLIFGPVSEPTPADLPVEEKLQAPEELPAVPSLPKQSDADIAYRKYKSLNDKHFQFAISHMDAEGNYTPKDRKRYLRLKRETEAARQAWKKLAGDQTPSLPEIEGNVGPQVSTGSGGGNQIPPEPPATASMPEDEDPLFNQKTESFSPLPEPTYNVDPKEYTEPPLFNQQAESYDPLPDRMIPPNVFDPDVKPRKKTPLEQQADKLAAEEKSIQDRKTRRSLSQMKRRADSQNAIQKRRETLRRRRERESITEQARTAKSEIKDSFDRGESDRLIRRLATFGIGRAVGIDGALVTALAEILVFQPEISKAESDMDSLLKEQDRIAAERMQELERSKVATTERRTVQSLDISEVVDDARERIANNEPVDLAEVEEQIRRILTRGVVDPGTGVPDPLTGQQSGPATEVFPETSEYKTPAEPGSTPQGAANLGPGSRPNAQAQSNGPIPPSGAGGGSFGGSGAVPPTGGMGTPPPLGPRGPGGTVPPPPGGGGGGFGAFNAAIAGTTGQLLIATAGLTALVEGSKIATESLTNIGKLVLNEKDVAGATRMAGDQLETVSTVAGAAIGSAFGPAGGVIGGIVGKAIGMVIVDPIVETIATGMGVIESVADKSIAPETVNARVNEDIAIMLKRLEQGNELDQESAAYIEARTKFTDAVMDLKTNVIQLIDGPVSLITEQLAQTISVMATLTGLLNGEPPSLTQIKDLLAQFLPPVWLANKLLSNIVDNTEKENENNSTLDAIDSFFMGGDDPNDSVRGSFRANITPWMVQNNLSNFNP